MPVRSHHANPANPLSSSAVPGEGIQRRNITGEPGRTVVMELGKTNHVFQELPPQIKAAPP